MTSGHLSLLLREAADRSDGGPVVHGPGGSLPLRDLLQHGEAVARALVDRGAAPGRRIAYLGPTSPTILPALHAAALLGCVLVPLNWRLTRTELVAVLKDAGCDLVVEGEWAPVDLTGEAEVVRVADVRAVETRRDPVLADPLLQIYTSGTTARPKGVLVTHHNLVGKFAREPNPWGIDADAVVHAAMPLFHVGGLGWLLGALLRGADVVVDDDTTPAGVVEAVREHRVTHSFLVPAAITPLLDAGVELDGTTLRSLTYGAAPMERSMLDAALAAWPGLDLIQGYGLTETTGQVVSLDGPGHRAAVAERRPVPTGCPDPGVEIAILTGPADDGTGIGEVLVRGDQVSSGYWGDPTPLVEGDGWLATGDLGRLDEAGRLHVVDRLKDLIISGGENVVPAEVEACLEADPSVREVAVIGIPSARWGEVPLALVVPAAGGLDTDALTRRVEKHLSRFKRPVGYVEVAVLPRNAVGKIVKRRLKEAWADWSRTDPEENL